MAEKPLTLDEVCRMSKAQLYETAAEFNIVQTSSKKSDLLSELLSKLPGSLDKPPSLSKIEDIADTADDDVLGAKVKTTAPKPPSSPGSLGSVNVFKDPPNDIQLEYEKIQLKREKI